MTETDETDFENVDQSNETEQPSPEVNRRQVLTAAAAIAGAGAAGYGGYLVGEAEAAPSGTVGTSAEPLLRVYADQLVFVNRSSDPSSPDNGTVWYNG